MKRKSIWLVLTALVVILLGITTKNLNAFLASLPEYCEATVFLDPEAVYAGEIVIPSWSIVTSRIILVGKTNDQGMRPTIRGGIRFDGPQTWRSNVIVRNIQFVCSQSGSGSAQSISPPGKIIGVVSTDQDGSTTFLGAWDFSGE